MAYPILPKPSAPGSSDTLSIPVLRSESEGAYTKVRRITTKAKNEFTLKYNKLTKVNYAILSDYFSANQGLSFDFVHPDTNITHTCVFMQDSIKKTHIDGVLSSTVIKLEEV